MTQLVDSKAKGADLAGTIIVNFLLTVLTLGIFYFWGKTRIRRYIWATTYVDGEPLHYEGRGLEMLLGSLTSIVGLVIFGICVCALIIVAPTPDTARSLILLLLLLPAIFFIRPCIHYRSIRYIASRTKLRGIQWFVEGSPFGYSLRYAARLMLSILTLSLAYPWMRAANWRDRVGNTRFGDAQFSSDAKGSELILVWFVCVLLAVPTVSLSFFYYRAYELLYLINSTSLTGKKVVITASRLELMWLKVTSTLLLIITVGLGYPWVLARQIRWWSAHVESTGAIDYSRIRQSQAPAPLLGDVFFAEGIAV